MALYLVRHGSAGVRNDHDPHDDDRRLDATGRLQSERLSEWLVHEAPTVLRSSPYLRCRQTLEPLATALGIDVVVDDRLAEGTPVEASWSLLEELSECSARRRWRRCRSWTCSAASTNRRGGSRSAERRPIRP